jgi:hypothetical protein
MTSTAAVMNRSTSAGEVDSPALERTAPWMLQRSPTGTALRYADTAVGDRPKDAARTSPMSRCILNPMRRSVSVVLVEGLPGSGKTTTSRQIAAEYRRRGRPCAWEREEARDHPFFGPDIRRLHAQPDYDEICLLQRRRVVEASRQTLWVLDGCAMQSTVRFMFEQNWPIDRTESYWRRFEQAISRARAVLVYFTHPRPDEFVHRHTIPARGDAWPKIARYV